MSMKSFSGVEFQRRLGAIQDIAMTEPVAITNHGRERLVLLSAEEYRRLKSRDRQVMATEDLPEDLAEEFAATEMDPRHAHLD